MQKQPLRIKSAAFVRRKAWEADQKPKVLQHFSMVAIPMSESRYSVKPCEHQVPRKNLSSSTKTSASQIWRQVHSTRSEFRLRSLSRGQGDQPVRKNLQQKVDRIKSKFDEHQLLYAKCRKAISRVSLEKSRVVQSQGGLGELSKKIMQLLIPLEQSKVLSEDRYRARLLRIRK